MKKILIGIYIFLIAAVIGFFILPKVVSQNKSVHYHAGFQVYVDEKLQNFSDWKYMHELPCTVDGKPIDDHEDEQIEKAHLHDQVGDVVHVHRIGAKWKDLFVNIKFPIAEQKLTAYVNGKQADTFLNQEIKPYDSVVLFIGKHADDQKYLKQAVKKEYIQKREKKSETCGVDPSPKQSNDHWKNVLTAEQYHVLREGGTDVPFSHAEMLNNHEKGTYVTADCNEPVFRSEDKFDSGTGWPSFTKPINDAVIFKEDGSLGLVRVEVLGKKCGGHLGHVFDDGPQPTGKRYCINASALKFIPDKK